MENQKMEHITEAGVLDEPYSAKPAPRSSQYGLPLSPLETYCDSAERG
jgi:hypothetical protein